jgi:hypothetical protein
MDSEHEKRFDDIDDSMKLNTVLAAGNLFLNLQQSNNVIEARKQLERIEKGLLQESLRKEILEILRDFVFSTGKKIQKLSEQLNERPLQVYIKAKITESEYTINKIAPSTFPEFQDMEYTQRVLDSLSELLDRGKNLLDESQVKIAETTVKYILEMPMLIGALTNRMSRDYLNDTALTWNELVTKRSKKTYKGFLLILPSLVICPLSTFCLISGVPFSTTAQQSDNSITGLLGMCIYVIVLIILPILAIGFGIFSLITKTPEGYNELKKVRMGIENLLESTGDPKNYIELFGDLTCERVRQVAC